MFSTSGLIFSEKSKARAARNGSHCFFSKKIYSLKSIKFLLVKISFDAVPNFVVGASGNL
jgi:hypothetical protein